MSVTKIPLYPEQFTERKLAEPYATVAGNAGATKIYTRLMPNAGKLTICKALIKMAAGSEALPQLAIGTGPALTTGIITATGHGLSFASANNVYPVQIAGATQPTGVSATAVYFAVAIDANTLAIYDTMAHAVAAANTSAGTGAIIPSVVGATVVMNFTTVNAVFEVIGAVANRAGNCALVGTVAVVAALKDADPAVEPWAATIVADTTAGAQGLAISITPDVTLSTRATCFLEFTEDNLDSP